MQGADEGWSREKVSWASVNAADTSLEVRDEVAASSRAELKEVVMDHPSGPKPHRFICENWVAPLPGRIRTVWRASPSVYHLLVFGYFTGILFKGIGAKPPRW